MTRRFYAHADTLTKAEYDALELARPYTDHAIGGSSNAKRDTDALCSALFTDTSAVPVIERRKPGDVAVCPVEPRKGRKRPVVPQKPQNAQETP